MAKLKLVFDGSVVPKGKGKNELVYESLKEITKNVPNESVYSATFSLALDAVKSRSKVFLIKQKDIKKAENIYEDFEVK